MGKSDAVHLSHNVSILIYHFVCPAKYRRVVFGAHVAQELKSVCGEIQVRYDIRFLEIGADRNHVHFLIQSVSTMSPTQIIRTEKSITAREIFRRCPEVKKELWGGEFWSDGYYVSTVAQYATESVIGNYVKKQGREEEYQKIHSLQISLFD
jgi:REP element-mobilizing transposase RayT